MNGKLGGKKLMYSNSSNAPKLEDLRELVCKCPVIVDLLSTWQIRYIPQAFGKTYFLFPALCKDPKTGRSTLKAGWPYSSLGWTKVGGRDRLVWRQAELFLVGIRCVAVFSWDHWLQKNIRWQTLRPVRMDLHQQLPRLLPGLLLRLGLYNWSFLFWGFWFLDLRSNWFSSSLCGANGGQISLCLYKSI